MSKPRLYHPGLSPGRDVLSAAESHHAGLVLRCRCGDDVVLFDGSGREAVGRVVSVGPGVVAVDVAEVVERGQDPDVHLTLAVAMPRRPRQSFLFEKCTELGVWAIWPTVYERSVARPKRDQLDRWRRTTIEAAKQCGRCRLPQIEGPMTFGDTLVRAEEFQTLLVTYCGTSDIAMSTRVANELTLSAAERVCGIAGTDADASTFLVWVGPEGGLSASELDALKEVGAETANLGYHVLRVETAALTVAAVVGALADWPGAMREEGTD